MTTLVPNHGHTALRLMRHFGRRAIDHASVWGVACVPHSLATELAKEWLLMGPCLSQYSLKCLLDNVDHFGGTEDERIGIGGWPRAPGILAFRRSPTDTCRNCEFFQLQGKCCGRVCPHLSSMLTSMVASVCL